MLKRCSVFSDIFCQALRFCPGTFLQTPKRKVWVKTSYRLFKIIILLLFFIITHLQSLQHSSAAGPKITPGHLGTALRCEMYLSKWSIIHQTSYFYYVIILLSYYEPFGASENIFQHCPASRPKKLGKLEVWLIQLYSYPVT